MLCSATTRAADFTAQMIGDFHQDKIEDMFRQPFIRTASVVLVRKSFNARVLYSRVLKLAPEAKFPNSPFAIMDTVELDKVRVFPNIRGDWHMDFAHPMWPIRESFVLPLWQQIQTDLENPAKAKRWQLGNDKLIRMARKRDLMTYGRFLTQCTNLQSELKWRDDQVRTLAERLQSWHAKLTFCKEPMDYFEMYKAKTGGCSAVGTTYFGTWSSERWTEFGEKGYFPSVWYHYNPHMQGVYMRHEGNVVARAFLWRDDPSKDFDRFGYVRAMGVYGQTVTEELQAMGYKLSRDYWTCKVAFKVPGFDVDGEMCMPLSNMDQVHKDFGLTYDKEANEFTVWPKGYSVKAYACTDTYSHRGYVKSSLCPATPK